MHHKNHKNSTSNHNNPAHINNKFPTSPAPSSERKSVLSRFRERFQEKPASKAEIDQLRLNTVREELKTRKQLAKSRRPSRFAGFGGGEPRPSYRRGNSRAPPQTGSWLLGEPSKMGDNFFSGGGEGPSLDFITGANSKPARRGKQSSGFGQGLSDLFT